MRLQAALAADAERAFAPPPGSTATAVATQRALLVSAVAEHRARLAGLDYEFREFRGHYT